MNYPTLVSEVFSAFSVESAAVPSVTLRAGNALDDYSEPTNFDPCADVISDAYLEQYHWGIGYLDPASWRHYLPHLIEYAVRHVQVGSGVIDSLLNSLRPPDRDPPRLASLSAQQEAAVTRFLDFLAFSPESAQIGLACQVLEEWWVPGALYR
ncbi:DUF6714 family protein [Pseudomonas cavernicola]|uniref:DUF6714 family protein n=1 Tax=Pseudomonas cavernicola TaxID=2320866 RepID=UPI0011C47BA9|nr:DUF6714 family protein [Pseudomonas cavernicola]